MLHRISIVCASALALSFTLPSIGTAQDYQPARDIQFVIPWAPGGGADVFGRKVIEAVRTDGLTNVNLNPDNRPGGSSAVGIGYVAANATGTNDTLVVLNTAGVITPLTVAGAPGWKELTPIANLMAEDYVIFVKADSPLQNIEDLTSAATKAPQALSFAVGGVGDQLASRVVGKAIGAEFNLVSFSGGGETINALLGGNVDATISNPAEFLGQLESGAIRALATTRDKRYADAVLADVPTLAETGIEHPVIQNWRGIAGPKDMAPEAVAYWQDVLAKATESAVMGEFLVQNSASPLVLTGQDYVDYITQQEQVFEELLK
ncbi:tripartite tricarboxylate transporter substrate binding protein [Paracoccus caeni]|uniref:Tripartite tricarboxylate transporter substrate binding protein n=1 Tax=Paracoccus caeni TaxID=657651 RepID=A0A934SI60_9RHOB|nr:tripartite tricarboxylate transporter substrate binding protein [Paracoccus caeni]MBK4217915.1 tripartite tricarboxylate transporter substrate binding protein [Paracoccus caeni]